MIYSKFGSQVTLVSKQQDRAGILSIQGTAEGSAEIREYAVGDLKADDGSGEIGAAIAKLPWKAVAKKPERGSR
jgi:hypothetical protein